MKKLLILAAVAAVAFVWYRRRRDTGVVAVSLPAGDPPSLLASEATDGDPGRD